MPPRRLLMAALLAAALAPLLRGQSTTPRAASTPGKPSDIELVERLLAARREYQATLEALRAHYIAVGDLERARWAEDELLQYHRIPKQAFRLELDVPPPILEKTATKNVPEANELYRRAVLFKEKGWGTDYVDNQRRTELLLQQLLTNYPQSDKISDAAYQLGDVYESKAYRQYKRAAMYFERCYQWNPKTQFPARMRAARLYERQLNDRSRALEIYREITTHGTDPVQHEEAQKKIAELSGRR